MVDKVTNLRIFEDENDKMNLSLKDINGEVMAVSQFTLYGDARKGRRPSFSDAARPDVANPLYEEFVEKLSISGINCRVLKDNTANISLLVEVNDISELKQLMKKIKSIPGVDEVSRMRN